MAPCEPIHLALIEMAQALIRKRFRTHQHHVGAALRTRSGRVYSAVNLGTHVDRASVCAEPITIGMAVAAGEVDIQAIVAVDREGLVLSPCGVCRELIAEYAPECEVIVPDDTEPEVVRIRELLPRRYHRRSPV